MHTPSLPCIILTFITAGFALVLPHSTFLRLKPTPNSTFLLPANTTVHHLGLWPEVPHRWYVGSNEYLVVRAQPLEKLGVPLNVAETCLLDIATDILFLKFPDDSLPHSAQFESRDMDIVVQVEFWQEAGRTLTLRQAQDCLYTLWDLTVYYGPSNMELVDVEVAGVMQGHLKLTYLKNHPG